MSELIDLDAVRQLKEFITDDFPEVVETYKGAAARYVSAIQDGHAAKDAKMVKDAAHPMKSSSGNLGLMRLFELAEAIEAQAMGIEEGNAAFETLDEMVAEIGPVHEKSIALLEAEV